MSGFDLYCFIITFHSYCCCKLGFLVQPFPSLQWLQLIRVPPSTIDDFPYLKCHLIRLEVSHAGVNALSELFGSPTSATCQRLKTFRQKYVLYLKAPDVGTRSRSTDHSTATSRVHPPPTTPGSQVPITFVLPLDDFMETKGSKQINLLWSNMLFLRLHNCGLTHLDSSLCLLRQTSGFQSKFDF